MDATALGQEYLERIYAFRRALPDPGLRLHFHPREDLRRQLLCHWKQTGTTLTPEHCALYNALGQEGEEVSLPELRRQTGQALPPPEPEYLERLRRYDQSTGHRTAERYLAFRRELLSLQPAPEAPASPAKPEAPREAESPRPQRVPNPPSSPEKQNPPAPPETPKEADPPQETLEDLLAQLDALTGLKEVKEEVRRLINLMKIQRLRAAEGLPAPPLSLHLVFVGNPGTGKTTVARLVGKLYRAIGVLPRGQLVEVDRAGLVAGYTGQTALKTRGVLESAVGGVLFLDEAYALTPPDSPQDFGREAVEVILKGMEDHREDLAVIAAGYPGPMEGFLKSNPGLASRFGKRLSFADYDPGEMLEIFLGLCEKNGYAPTQQARLRAAAVFGAWYESRGESFGNARAVRNLFEEAAQRQADRLSGLERPSRGELMALEAADLETAENGGETVP